MEEIGHHVIYSATAHHPGVLLVFSWCEHLPRKFLKTMEKNTTQLRLEHRIGKQVSAWTLKFVFKTASFAICLALNIKLLSMRLAAAQSYKGVQHLFERNIILISRILTAVQSFFEEIKESMEGGQHCFRMESFEYECFTIMVFLTESVGASMGKASCKREWTMWLKNMQ